LTSSRDNRKAVATAFGRVMRGLRHQRGLSQDEVARLGDFDRTYPSLLERGLRNPTLPFLFDLARVLEVHPATLVGRAFEDYAHRVGLTPPSDMNQPAPIEPAQSAVEPQRKCRVTTVSMQRWTKNRVPLRALHDPLRAIGILEATLKGEALASCAERLGLKRARCDQLTRLAAVLLLQPRFVMEDEVPPHDWSRARKRFANRDFWLRLIRRAKGLIVGGQGAEDLRKHNDEHLSSGLES
jgi:DNA-binding XRE family transcriptional regulator